MISLAYVYSCIFQRLVCIFLSSASGRIWLAFIIGVHSSGRFTALSFIPFGILESSFIGHSMQSLRFPIGTTSPVYEGSKQKYSVRI